MVTVGQAGVCLSWRSKEVGSTKLIEDTRVMILGPECQWEDYKEVFLELGRKS